MPGRHNWNSRIVTIENKGATAFRMGLGKETNPYNGGSHNQNGTGGQFQRQRAKAWLRGWENAKQRREAGEKEDLPTRYWVHKPESNRTLVQVFYHTGEKLNPWRCGACATRQQHREILEEIQTADVLQTVGTGICCRKCGMDFMT